MKKIPLKIGFDLDGVLLYNPARIFRPATIVAKSILRQKKQTKTEFYYPKTVLEKILWNIVHWSSLYIADGYDEIKKLSEHKNIQSYIITSRYDCLKKDFDRWLSRMHADAIFTAAFHNKNNLQPHVFKAQKIKELGLDFFVEDNWDIVQHINNNTQAKGLWISNAFDKSIPYNEKFMSLKEVMKYIKKELCMD